MLADDHARVNLGTWMDEQDPARLQLVERVQGRRASLHGHEHTFADAFEIPLVWLIALIKRERERERASERERERERETERERASERASERERERKREC